MLSHLKAAIFFSFSVHERDPKMKIADIVDGDRLGKCVTSTCDTYFFLLEASVSAGMVHA